MQNNTQNQQMSNNNTTWIINTNDFNFIDRLEYLRPNFVDNMYNKNNKNTTWTAYDFEWKNVNELPRH